MTALREISWGHGIRRSSNFPQIAFALRLAGLAARREMDFGPAFVVRRFPITPETFQYRSEALGWREKVKAE
jgi:hypothetical protein